MDVDAHICASTPSLFDIVMDKKRSGYVLPSGHIRSIVL